MLKTEKHPLTVGIVSSLLASGLLGLIPAVRAFWKKPVPAWGVLLVVLCMIIIGAVLYFGNRNRRRIAIVVSAFSRKQFFSEVIQHTLLESALKRWEAVVKIPASDYNPAHQDGHFSELCRHRDGYVGALVIPIEPMKRKAELRRFANSFGRPIVFLDTQPFEAEEFPERCCYVGFDGNLGGRLAADAMAQVFRSSGRAEPNILVLASNIQVARQVGFQERIKELLPHSTVIVDTNGRFLREEATRLVRHHFSRTPNARQYHGIFCTNDEMALGALAALQTLPPRSRSGIVVVGFDGIMEATVTIDRGKSHIVNTVVQDIGVLAATAVEKLDKMKRGEAVQPVTLIQPRLYRKLG